MIASNAYQTVHSARIGSAGAKAGMDIAYADISGSGEYDRAQDCVIFSMSESGSGSAMSYADLKSRVDKLGGEATARQLCGFTDDQTQEVTSRSDFGKHPAGSEKDTWISFAQMPVGLTHPLVDFVFHSDDSGLRVDYLVQEKARVVPTVEGDPFTAAPGVDLNADGIAEPAHDSLLRLKVQQRAGLRDMNTAFSYGHLKQAIKELGGEADEESLSLHLATTLDDPFIEPAQVTQAHMAPLPARVHADMPDDVQRVFSLTEDGGVEINYGVEQRERH